MSELKTRPHAGDVEAFLAAVANEKRREGDWRLTGLSPRMQSLVVYIMTSFPCREELLAKLGKTRPANRASTSTSSRTFICRP